VAPFGITGADVLNELFEAAAAVIDNVGRITLDKVTGSDVTAWTPAFVTFRTIILCLGKATRKRWGECSIRRSSNIL